MHLIIFFIILFVIVAYDTAQEFKDVDRMKKSDECDSYDKYDYVVIHNITEDNYIYSKNKSLKKAMRNAVKKNPNCQFEIVENAQNRRE